MTVVGFAGHRDLPTEVGNYLDEYLAAALACLGPRPVGVCCLASGADQRFAAILLAAGGSLNVVIPAQGYEQTFRSERDRSHYRSLLARASRTEVLDFSAPTDSAFVAAGRRVVESCDALLAVWDGKGARGPGGTAEVVAYAQHLHRPTTIVWPEGVNRT